MSYYVYFIQQKGKGNQPVKIGYSKSPEKRLESLQTSNPQKLKICMSFPFDSESEAREMERTMHWLASKRFKRLNGEWFIIYGSWKKFISQCFKIYDKNQEQK